MQIKIHHLNSQRNGVQGNSFYAAHIEVDNERLIATFETVEGHDNIVNCQTCRVINPLKPFDDYRGDEIGRAISKHLGKTEVYNLIGAVKYPELYPKEKQNAIDRLRELGSDLKLYGAGEEVRLQTWQEEH